MTIRSDLTVNWDTSPRIITVAAPSTEVTIQDLHDTCRYLESQQSAMDDDHLIDTAGKEFLGGITYVGLTATLNNAVLAFEARPGPNWVLCQILGGNLVAIDADGNYIDPRYPTAYTTVDRTASASATLQEQEAIQFSSFDGGVTFDPTSSYVGTTYPVGTPQQPVNNLSDTMSIATERGFNKIYVIGNAVIDTGGNYEDMIFIGESQTKSNIYISPEANVLRCEFYDSYITGTLDGEVLLENCLVGNINYVNGFMEHCVLSSGTITLGGGADAHILDCWSGVAGTGTPTIDMGGSGQQLGLRNYNGGIAITNKTGQDNVSIDLNSGHVHLTSSVVSGTVVVRGVGYITNECGPNVNCIDENLVNPQNIANTMLSTGVESSTASGTVGEAIRDTADNSRLIPGTL